jgi:cell division protein FtsB
VINITKSFNKTFSKIKKRKGIVILLIIILVWLTYFTINLASDISKIKEYEDINNQLSNVLQEEIAENEKLENTASQDDKTLKENIARQEYGYVYPNEHVYVDIAPYY